MPRVKPCVRVQATILHLSHELERRLKGFRPAVNALQIVHVDEVALPLSSPAYGQGSESSIVSGWHADTELQKDTTS